MFKPFSLTSSFLAFLLLQCTCFPAETSAECVDVNSPRIRMFEDLVSFQNNKISFSPSDSQFEGNYVNFTDPKIDTLYKNSFITRDSEHIQKLFLDNHQIRTIEEGAFMYLNCVMTLNLQKNKIKSISKGIFADLRALHELDLGENRIKEIPERVFIYNARLRKLNLSRNNLKVLYSESFLNLSRLEELDLSYNSLFSIRDDTFKYFINLVNLQLGSNRLERVDMEKFTMLSKLSVLNLSDNALESFDTANRFSFGASLTELYLSDNLLTHLNPLGVRRNLRFLKLIDIDDNPWSCSDLVPILSNFNDTRLTYTGSSLEDPNIAGIGCNKSLDEYKRRKLLPPVEVTTVSRKRFNPPENSTYSPRSLNVKLNKVEEEFGNFYYVAISFFVIIVLFQVIHLLIRCHCFDSCNRFRNNNDVLDDNDVETFSLLRRRL